MSTEHLNITSQKVLEILINLNQWEWSNVPALQSVIGRHVYFSIATELLSQTQPAGVRSLKQVFNHPSYTDRAIRLKLREMEKIGLIKSECSGKDKRVRFLVPTEKFIALVASHTQFCKHLLNKDFMLLEK